MSNLYPVVATMQRYGGSFVRKLAEAWLAADAINRAKLEAAFADTFTEYAAIAEQWGQA